jgi:hypothetical protein
MTDTESPSTIRRKGGRPAELAGPTKSPTNTEARVPDLPTSNGEAGAYQLGERPAFGASGGQGMRTTAPSPDMGMENEAKNKALTSLS